ncbi:MAG TPA: hypothetical protein VEP89_15785 [Draconibacterium sp.]|nr:hypothetical protein [Draconibacterium sp.]
MKKTLLIAASMLLLFVVSTSNVKAQEWSTGLDIYSSYIWRGAKFGSGPAFQPYVEMSAGDFAIGAWGSVSGSIDESLEMDLYAGYSIALSESSSLDLAVTDYYFGGDWTEYSSMHYLEPSVSLGLGDFSLTAAYMFLPEAEMEDGSTTSFGEEADLYLEAGYSFGSVDLGFGMGDGQYTDDGDFGVCNIMLGTSKDIEVTDTFTLPVSGAVILNPSTGGFFITVGISL